MTIGTFFWLFVGFFILEGWISWRKSRLQSRLDKAREEGLTEGVRRVMGMYPPFIPNVGNLLSSRGVQLKNGEAMGSGFMLDDSYLLTAWHVVDRDRVKSMTLDSSDGRLRGQSFDLVAFDKDHDLALCKIRVPVKPLYGHVFSPVKIAQSAPMKVVYFLWHRDPKQWAVLRYTLDASAGIGYFGRGDLSPRPGDSGSVGVDVEGRVVTLVKEGIFEETPGVGPVVRAQGPTILALRNFLTKHWPNFEP